MKTLRFLLFFGLTALVFTNCKKDGDDFEGIRVSIDGKSWTPSVSAGVGGGFGFLSLTGSDPIASKSIVLVLPEDVTSGEYALGNEPTIAATYVDGATNSLSATSGKITVTEHDRAGKRIKGTFEFEGENPLTGDKSSFTDGEFNVQYQ